MSGIYIPKMEMPKCCRECRFLEGYDLDGLCHAAERWLDDDFWMWFVYDECDIDTSKPSNCPLIPVPDHGRLIDADELAKTFREDADDDWNKHATPFNWSDAFSDVADMVDDAPTIIPEDKEGAE